MGCNSVLKRFAKPKAITARLKMKNKWKPKKGEAFYELEVSSAFIGVNKDYWHYTDCEAKNTFRTKKEAQTAAKKIKEILRG